MDRAKSIPIELLPPAELAGSLKAIGPGTPGRYLLFRVREREFALPLAQVQELIMVAGLEPAPPGAPHAVCGLFRLRGQPMTAIDLGRIFGQDAAKFTSRSCLIICKTAGDVTVGVLVDSVSEIVEIPGERLRPNPELVPGVPAESVMGRSRIKGRIRIFVDIERILLAYWSGCR